MSEHSDPSRRSRKTTSRNHHRVKPPNPNISSFRRRTFTTRRLKHLKPIKHDLLRCKSEPILLSWTIGVVFYGDDDSSKFNGVPQTQSCANIFAPVSPLPSNSERYNKDAKVVVNVTVEGSPGPVKTLVKLGASVEDTIKLVVDKYSEEGRSPQIGRDGVSSFELHQSHFSLESLSKKGTIGDVGSRSFYLRKSCSGRSSNEGGISQLDSFSSTTGMVSVKSSTPPASPFTFMSTFISRKISKIGRRMSNLWKVLVCSR
ncbi:hypothetical protein IFM89_023005 [Coptis chinensis]|uniref:DUF7054 domain-containing protein n=1 Tax=Coptis chinensis TaxID=261450 RepID=A0A835M695_9MAGN|nr:hypothetical protein IFM89_023005 [Coptis chinensis]